jgi:hypothetical protein
MRALQISEDDPTTSTKLNRILWLGPELASLPTPCGSAIIAFAELEEMVSCDTLR